MRKRFALLGVLIIAAAVFLTWAEEAVDDYKDNVGVYEDVLMGDRTEAEGLRVESVTNMDSRLFWNTDFWPGTDREAVTEFQFYPDGKHERWNFDENYMKIGPANANFGISSSGIDLEEESNYGQRGMWEPVRDVASRAPAGEEYKETVFLKDYYEWYPLEIDAEFYHPETGRQLWMEREDRVNQELTDFFRISIPENVKLDITIQKSDFAVTRVECTYSDDSYINLNQWAYGVMTEEGGYVAIIENSEQWKDGMLMSLRSEQIAQDYGIYHIPLKVYEDGEVIYEEGSEKIMTFDTDNIRNEFPIDSEIVNVQELHYDIESDQLLLMTEEGGRLYMTIIDRKTMTELQKLDLGEIGETEFVTQTLTQDNLRMIQIREAYVEGQRVTPQRIVLLVKEGERWSVKMKAPVTWDGQEDEQRLFGVNEYAQMTWDGEKLAIAQFARYYDNCDVYVLICKDDELTYVGAYRRGDTSGNIHDYNSSIRPFNDEGLIPVWE